MQYHQTKLNSEKDGFSVALLWQSIESNTLETL